MIKALDRLTGRARHILVLRFIEERKVEEIARLLGKSTATASNHIKNALQRLRDELARKPLK